MIVPHLKQQEFIDHLKNNGCDVVSDENWEEHDRIIMKYGDETFPLQMQTIYYYFTVNKICQDLGIQSHELCKKVKQQLKSINREKK